MDGAGFLVRIGTASPFSTFLVLKYLRYQTEGDFVPDATVVGDLEGERPFLLVWFFLDNEPETANFPLRLLPIVSDSRYSKTVFMRGEVSISVGS